MNRILLIGSGKSATKIATLNLSRFSHIVAVNHGWMATEQWNYWFHSRDFNGKFPEIRPDQTEILTYDEQLAKYGGEGECGFSVMLNASYYVLAEFDPQEICYLGADMNYTPASDGSTHIYGVGFDIKKNGKSDPDLMVERYGGEDPNFLSNLYTRFAIISGEAGCKLWNLSGDPHSRLPYQMWIDN